MQLSLLRLPAAVVGSVLLVLHEAGGPVMFAMVRFSILAAIGVVAFIYVCAGPLVGLWPFALVVFWPLWRVAGFRFALPVKPLTLEEEAFLLRFELEDGI
jgi:hypothetical protein